MNDYSPAPLAEQAKGGPGQARAAFWAVLLVGALCGATAVLDMDFHWHLALGRLLVAQGFPASEPFSHLPAGVPDRQSWLADAGFAILDRIGGLVAIRALCGAVFAAGCLSVLRLARRRTTSPALAILCVSVYVALAMARLRIRPDLFTLALTPLFLELLLRPPSWRQPIAVLIVSALWANLHAGALIGGLLALTQIWPLDWRRVANALAAWVGLCLTPEGLGALVRYTADTTALRPLIPEWQRLWERPLAEFAPEWAVVVGVLGMTVAALVVRLSGAQAVRIAHACWPRASGEARATAALGPGEAARALLGFGLAASAVRFLFTLFLPTLWAASILDRIVAERAQLRALAIVAVLAIFVFFPLERLRQTSAGIKAVGMSFLGEDPPSFPVEAAQYLEKSGLSGNLAHPAGWGGYLALKLSPRFKTATDGRITHFGADLGREWSQGIDGPEREAIFARRGIDLVVAPANMLALFTKDQPYEPIYGDSFAVILLRLDGPNHVENTRIVKAAAKRR